MGLRNKLLTYFISIITIVILLFGWKAYYIAIDSTSETEAAFLREATRFEANILAQEYNRTLLTPTLQPNTNDQLKEIQHIRFLIDQHNNILDTNTAITGPVFVSLLRDFRGSKKDNNHFHIEDKHLLWVSESIPGTPYRLVHGLSSQHGLTDFFDELLNSLVVTALLIFWVSTWAALIISSNVARKIRQQTEALEYQAKHDNLTDLPNRTMLYEDLNKSIHDAQQNNQPITVMIMDLDMFKEVNDTLGHSTGDKLLLAVVERLQTMAHQNKIIARLGGDEFAIIIPDSGIDESTALAEELSQKLEATFSIDDLKLDIDASIGIALYPEHGDNADTLIKCADIAMYKAKQDNSEAFIYSPESDQYTIRRLTIMGDLRSAIEENQLVLYYQPKVDLKTSTVHDVEALLRWNHPKYGFIPPDEFVALAERSGLIRPLTLWVLNKAIQQCHLWKKDGINLTIAVNLSVRNLQESTLPDQIAELLDSWDVPNTSLMLEITESAFMHNPEQAKEILTRLNNMGIRCSIDDFGTGYSSLSMLGQLPVSEIKIDRSFVMDMMENEKHAVIVRSTIDLTHSLGREVTAEGVESQEAFDLLRSLGCEKAQGYHMSRPLPPQEFTQWLAEY